MVEPVVVPDNCRNINVIATFRNKIDPWNYRPFSLTLGTENSMSHILLKNISKHIKNKQMNWKLLRSELETA